MGNTFTGKIEGSDVYSVSLVLERRSEFKYVCPYEYDGTCKHCIGFGLAVIDLLGTIVQLADSTTIPDQRLVSLEQVWQQTCTTRK